LRSLTARGASPSALSSQELGARLVLVPYPNPGALADSTADGEWDVGLIGAEPVRAEVIGFSRPYAEIEATYLVPPGSALGSASEVDSPGVRIATSRRSAYALWLSANLKQAKLVPTDEPGPELSWELFRTQRLDALSGLRPWLTSKALELPGSSVLPDRFTAIQQAIGVPRSADAPACEAAVAFLDGFVSEAKRSGLVARLLAKHGVAQKLDVAM